MKISTEKFKQFDTIVNKASDINSVEGSKIFIDPNIGLCSCMGKDFKFTFNFDIIEENKEDLKPFFTDIEKFMAITQAYDEITINKNYQFINQKDHFNLYVEENATNFDWGFEYTGDKIQILELKSEDILTLKKAIIFTGEEQQIDGNNLNLVRIGPDKILASDTTFLYQNNLSEKIDFQIDVSKTIVSIICDLFSKGIEDIVLYCNENQNGFALKDKTNSFEIISEPVPNPYVPDDKTLATFEEALNRAENMHLTINRDEFKKAIDFIGIFLTQSINKPVILSCKEEGIDVKGIDSSNLSSGIKVIDNKFVSNIGEGIKSIEFCFPRKNMLQIVSSTFNSENITLSIGKNSKGNYNFVEVKEFLGNKEEKTIITLLKL